MKANRIAATLLVALIAIVALSISACARAPEEEMQAATQAVDRAASNPEVSRYAPQGLQRARQLLSEMESASENREFDSARSLAAEATGAADQAVRDAEAAKSRARSQAETAVAAANTDFAQAREAVTGARQVRGIRFDFAAAQNELERISGAVAAAEDDIEDEEFADAQATAQNARSSISNLVRRISDSVQAASRK